jgi:hypothetical protein
MHMRHLVIEHNKSLEYTKANIFLVTSIYYLQDPMGFVDLAKCLHSA